MKKLLSTVLFTIAIASSSVADVVDWSMIGGAVYTNISFTATVDDGTETRFGTFGIGYDFTGKSFSTLLSDFTTWDSGVTSSGGTFYETSANTTGPLGTPWYMFLGSSASSFGIFGNSAWVNSGDINLQFADLSDPGTFAAGGFGAVSGLNVALVPEPSTGLLIGMGSIAFLLLRRRKKVS